MASALLKKSVTDLTRRKARTVFTVLTLAIAVASVGIFAIPSLMDTAMQKEVQANKLPDLTLSTEAARADAGAARGAAAAAERRRGRRAQLLPDARLGRRAAREGGDHRRRPRLRATSRSTSSRSSPGAAAGRLSVLSDVQNDKQGRFSGTRRRARSGSSASATGRVTVPVSGVARNLIGDQAAIGLDAVVLYSTPALLARLGAETGYSSLEFRLADTSKAAADRTVARGAALPDGEHVLHGRSPTCRSCARPGTYPGKELFDQLASIMNVFTVLALLAGLVLISNTMTTLIGEQRREIGMMKAIGGTRRQIRRVYLRTALLLGAAGSVIGVALGLAGRERGRPLLRLELLRDLARLRGRRSRSSSRASSSGCSRRRSRRCRRSAAARGSRCARGSRRCPRSQGGQAVLDRALRRLSLPAADGADRRPQRHPPRAAQRHDGRADRARGRDAARGARADQQRHRRRRTPSGTRRTGTSSSNTAVGTQFDARADRLIRTTPGVAQAQPMLDEPASSSRARTRSVNGFRERPLFETPISRRPLVHAAGGGRARAASR